VSDVTWPSGTTATCTEPKPKRLSKKKRIVELERLLQVASLSRAECAERAIEDERFLKEHIKDCYAEIAALQITLASVRASCLLGARQLGRLKAKGDA